MLCYLTVNNKQGMNYRYCLTRKRKKNSIEVLIKPQNRLSLPKVKGERKQET